MKDARERSPPLSLSARDWKNKAPSIKSHVVEGFLFFRSPLPFPRGFTKRTFVLLFDDPRVKSNRPPIFHFIFLSSSFFCPSFFYYRKRSICLFRAYSKFNEGFRNACRCARKTRVSRDAGFTCHGLWINFDFRRAGARLRLANGAGERGWFSTRYTVHICMYFVRNFSSFANN